MTVTLVGGAEHAYEIQILFAIDILDHSRVSMNQCAQRKNATNPQLRAFAAFEESWEGCEAANCVFGLKIKQALGFWGKLD
jgi:hypothetical protein